MFYERTKKKWIPFLGLGKFNPKKNHFDGNLYVLINGGTSSAAGEFSGMLRAHERAQFIGSETGGNPIVLSGSVVSNLHILPNTKLKGFVGTLCSFNDQIEKNTGYGLLPDYPVQWNSFDLQTGKDPVQSFTYELIHQRNIQHQLLNTLKDSINGQWPPAPPIFCASALEQTSSVAFGRPIRHFSSSH